MLLRHGLCGCGSCQGRTGSAGTQHGPRAIAAKGRVADVGCYEQRHARCRWQHIINIIIVGVVEGLPLFENLRAWLGGLELPGGAGREHSCVV